MYITKNWLFCIVWSKNIHRRWTEYMLYATIEFDNEMRTKDPSQWEQWDFLLKDPKNTFTCQRKKHKGWS